MRKISNPVSTLTPTLSPPILAILHHKNEGEYKITFCCRSCFVLQLRFLFHFLIHLQSTHTVYGLFTIALIYSQSIGHLHLISFIIRFFSILFFVVHVISDYFYISRRQSLVKGLQTPSVRRREKKFEQKKKQKYLMKQLVWFSYPSQ